MEVNFETLLNQDKQKKNQTHMTECSPEVLKAFNTDLRMDVVILKPTPPSITAKSMYPSQRNQEPILYNKPEHIISSKPSTI
jgi:hypothetical protein